MLPCAGLREGGRPGDVMSDLNALCTVACLAQCRESRASRAQDARSRRVRRGEPPARSQLPKETQVPTKSKIAFTLTKHSPQIFSRTPLRGVADYDILRAVSVTCSGGEIGRHACLRCMWRDPCGFESRPEHQVAEKFFYIAPLHNSKKFAIIRTRSCGCFVRERACRRL